MSTARYARWQDGDMWLGYFEEFPEYMTQGESLVELEDNLRDLYKGLTRNEIPDICKIADPLSDQTLTISFVCQLNILET
jgi:predicted RNase H-like HicB family nuclease